MNANLRLGILVLLAALLSHTAGADVLQLANGDRIQGELVEQDQATIRWRSPILGILSVAASKAAIVPDKPSAGPATSAVAASGPLPSPSPAPGWKTTLEAGMLMQTGRTDSTDTNFRAESNYVHNSNSYRLIGRYLYSESNRTVSTDRTEGSLRWRHELDKKWFYQTLSSYLSSKTKGLDHDVEQNLGLGYRIINTSRTSASIGAGLTGQYRDIHNSKVGKSLLGEFFQDLVFKYNPHLEFGEDFVAQYSPSGRGIRVLPNGQVQVLDTEVDNYRFSFKAFARGKFTESLSLSLRYEYEYDNPFATNNGKAEQRIITSLGYSF